MSDATQSSEEALQKPKSPPRLHFLDWLRLLLVLGVVYAHTAASGLRGGGGFSEKWLVDDKTLWDDPRYPGELIHSHIEGYTGGASPYAIRWISIVRQGCLPLLFWVSGAAVACSYRGGMPRGLDKLLLFTLVGMSCNAALWLLSPRIKTCVIDEPDCVGKGIVFDFSICGRAGCWFAIIFQMWYTVALGIMSLFNWPLFAAMHGSARSWALALQWLLTCTVYALFIGFSGEKCPNPIAALSQLAGLEAAFLILAGLDCPLVGQHRRPDWMPVRALHYLMASVALLQFGAVGYASDMEHLGPPYLAFMGTGFNRFFSLGFVMTHARRSGARGGDAVRPLMSRIWPVHLLICVFAAPSTNWELAGMLTYPFFAQVVDRCLYVSGSLLLVFSIDRLSRGVPCDALPDIFSTTSLMLFLFHPVLITVMLAAGLRSVMHVWILSICAGLLLASARACVTSLIQGQGKLPSGLDGFSEVCRRRAGSADDGDANGDYAEYSDDEETASDEGRPVVE